MRRLSRRVWTFPFNIKFSLPSLPDLVQLSIFVIASLLAVADLFSLLGPGGIWKNWPEQIAKLTLLLVGLMGTSLVIERRTRFSELEDQLVAMNELITGLHVTSKPTAVMLPSRQSLYKNFGELLSELPTSSQVLVTHFEKLSSVPYDTGEISEEEEAMKVWDHRILQKDFFVEQIVHVSSKRDLDEVHDRLAKFRDVPNFLLHVMIGAPVRPYIDFAVLGNRFALINFPADVMSARVADVAFLISDQSMVEFLAKYFKIWWGKYTVPIKTRNGIDEEALEALGKMLPQDDNESRTDAAFEMVMKLESDTLLEQMIKDIIDAYGKVKDLHELVFLERARASISSCQEELQGLAKGFTIMDSDGTLEMLNIISMANSTIDATSYFDNPNFWTTSVGEKVFEANWNAIDRGVVIRRVFILDPSQRISTEMRDVMKQHNEVGINVFVANSEEIGQDLKQDYLIQDDKLVLRNDLKQDQSATSTIVMDSYEVRKAQRAFQRILLHAKPLGSYL